MWIGLSRLESEHFDSSDSWGVVSTAETGGESCSLQTHNSSSNTASMIPLEHSKLLPLPENLAWKSTFSWRAETIQEPSPPWFYPEGATGNHRISVSQYVTTHPGKLEGLDLFDRYFKVVHEIFPALSHRCCSALSQSDMAFERVESSSILFFAFESSFAQNQLEFSIYAEDRLEIESISIFICRVRLERVDLSLNSTRLNMLENTYTDNNVTYKLL